MRSLVWALGAALSLPIALGACSHSVELTPDDELCNFTRYSLENALPDQPDLGSILDEAKPGHMLLLSGGSQDGAFGAGFLDEWNESGEMPDFRLVTGVSTGALQSTGAFIKDTQIAIDGYTIDEESEILDGYVDGDDVDPDFSAGAILTLLREGSIADLEPLRDELNRLLTGDVLRKVAARYDDEENRAFLLAGATDVDLGVAVAFDLTEMASRFAGATDPADQKHYKDCYISALIASSIVPPAAQPEFIDNRMYIDGGIRYAVFDDRLTELVGDMGSEPVADTPAPRSATTARLMEAPPEPSPYDNLPPAMFLILNHSGDSEPKCAKEDEDDCEPINSIKGQREDWEVLGLAVRTLELFENQIRRLSVERAEARAAETDRPFFFARIRSEDMSADRYRFSIGAPEGEEAKTCKAWLKDDDEAENPIEFHWRYMRCLIEYGRKRARDVDWDAMPGSGPGDDTAE